MTDHTPSPATDGLRARLTALVATLEQSPTDVSKHLGWLASGDVATALRALLADPAPEAAREDVLAILERRIEEFRDLDYDPNQEAWVCGAHGNPECQQDTCPDLPWPEPNDPMLGDFATWADREFRRIMEPFDKAQGQDRDWPEGAWRTYGLAEWPVGNLIDVISCDYAAEPAPADLPVATGVTTEGVRLSVRINDDCATHIAAMTKRGETATEVVRQAIALHKFAQDGGRLAREADVGRHRTEALREYRDALAANESAECWSERSDYLHDIDDWIASEGEGQ